MAQAEVTTPPLTQKQLTARANLVKAREKKAQMAQSQTPIEPPPNNEPILIPKTSIENKPFTPLKNGNGDPLYHMVGPLSKHTPQSFWDDNITETKPKTTPTYFWTDPEYVSKKLQKKREREETQLPPEAPPEKKQEIEPPTPPPVEETTVLTVVAEKSWGWAKVFLSMLMVGCLQQLAKKMAVQVASTPMEVDSSYPETFSYPRGNPRFLN